MYQLVRGRYPSERVTQDQIKERLLSGELSQSDLIKNQGARDWTFIESLPEFTQPSQGPAEPPPIPQKTDTGSWPDDPPPIPTPPAAESALLKLPPGSEVRRILSVAVDYGLMITCFVLIEKLFGNGDLSYATLAAFLLCLAFLLVKDGLFTGASPGKFLARLTVLDVETGKPCTILRSCLRNGVIPGSIVLGIIVGIPVRLIAGDGPAALAGSAIIFGGFIWPYRGIYSPNRRTNSDNMADTYVINTGTYRSLATRK